jgi:hypothetical protein
MQLQDTSGELQSRQMMQPNLVVRGKHSVVAGSNTAADARTALVELALAAPAEEDRTRRKTVKNSPAAVACTSFEMEDTPLQAPEVGNQ